MATMAPEHHLGTDWAAQMRAPPAFAAFDQPVEGLDVGSPGKVGVLDLELVRLDGATRIRRRYASGPICLLHPLYIDPCRPDMAFLYTIQLGGGLVQGDRYRISLDWARARPPTSPRRRPPRCTGWIATSPPRWWR